ncbi:MAG: YihY/virulence factor BrkB family protein [Opitutales bacterium]
MPKADPAPTTTPPAGFLEASWSPEALAERGWRGASKSAWRVIATTWHGVVAHRLPQQSAALTYYTLMSLGPLLGLALTVSGFILSRAGDQQDNPAKRAIVAAVEYAAPQIVAKASAEGHHATLREINKDLDALVDRLLKTAASGEAGVIGLLLLFGLAVLMLSRVEDALNGIWGVRFGRSWRDRFANYLLFLVVFFLVGATTLTMLSAASLAASFGAGATWLTGWLQKIPGGGWFADFVGGGGPLFVSLALLTLAFAAFNRMMPNARVRWSAALVGGLAIAVLVVCNHRLAALYVGKVTELQSLYGELSIVLVLLFGTYLSWLFVLIGGQVAYAYQNRRTLARHKSWEALSHRARRTLAFLCVAETLRRYRAGRTGPPAEDIGVSARVPASVAEGCLEMLRETGLLALESRTGGHKPARPLEAMTIGQFWGVVDEHATGRAGDLDLSADPAAREHAEIEGRLRVLPGAGVTLGELSARGQGHACS